MPKNPSNAHVMTLENKNLGIHCSAETGPDGTAQHTRWMSQPWPNDIFPNIAEHAETIEEAEQQMRIWYTWYCAIRCFQLGRIRRAKKYLALHRRLSRFP